MSAGLTQVSAHDLKVLLQAIEQGSLACPITDTGLMACGLGYLSAKLDLIRPLPQEAAIPLLRGVIAERDERPVPHVDLVWTGPESRGSTSRDTGVVVRQLFAGAQKSVLVSGYSFDHGSTILEPLHEAMKERGVLATLFLDVPGQAKDKLGMAQHANDKIGEFLERNWTFGEPIPEIYYDPRTLDPEIYASLHAKCVVVDERISLVGSANFTNRGQTRNLEVGALIEDPGFARSLLAQWRTMVDAALVDRYQPPTVA